jgi:hypothetical protein
MQLPASLARAGTLTLPTAAGRQVLVARLGTRDVALAGDGSIAIPADAAGSALTVVYR